MSNTHSNHLAKILADKPGANHARLAEAIGVSRTAVSRWASNDRLIPDGRVADIMAALDITHEELFISYTPKHNRDTANDPPDEAA